MAFFLSPFIVGIAGGIYMEFELKRLHEEAQPKPYSMMQLAKKDFAGKTYYYTRLTLVYPTKPKATVVPLVISRPDHDMYFEDPDTARILIYDQWVWHFHERSFSLHLISKANQYGESLPDWPPESPISPHQFPKLPTR